MAEHKLTTYFAIMIAINVVLWLAQLGIASINPAADSIYDIDGSPAARFVINDSLSGGLGRGVDDIELITSDSVEETTGNVFTDAIKTVKRWFSSIDSSLGLFTGILKQPYGFLKSIGTPIEIATAFGIIWYVMLALLVINFIKGGSAD
mgnify:CR=1 FL=1